MSTFTSLRSAITTLLGTVSELFEAFDFHTMSFTGYPVATFEPLANGNIVAENVNNERRHIFQIILHQEMESGGRDNAVTILTLVADAIITAFEEDPTLSNAADFCTPTIGEFTDYTGGDGAILALTITLTCVSETQVLT